MDAIAGRVARDRVMLSVADAWYALAPALVLVLAGAQTPDWSDWPIYLAGARRRRSALDGARPTWPRVWACLGEPPAGWSLPELHRTAISASTSLLAMVGLLAAFAAGD